MLQLPHQRGEDDHIQTRTLLQFHSHRHTHTLEVAFLDLKTRTTRKISRHCSMERLPNFTDQQDFTSSGEKEFSEDETKSENSLSSKNLVLSVADSNELKETTTAKVYSPPSPLLPLPPLPPHISAIADVNVGRKVSRQHSEKKGFLAGEYNFLCNMVYQQRFVLKSSYKFYCVM